MEKSSLSYAERNAGAEPTTRVSDQAAYEEALDLLHRAAVQPRYDSYHGELMARRIALLPKRTDFASQIVPLSYLAGQPPENLKLRSLVDLVGARAEQLSAEGDAEGFRELVADWTRILEKWSATPSVSVIDALILKVAVGAPAARFQKSAETLGLPEEAARWQAIHDQTEAEKEARKRRGSDETLKLKAGILAGMSLPMIGRLSDRAPQITDEDLKPSRLADHELFARIFSGIAWLVLGGMLTAAALYRFKTGPLNHHLARSLERLLRPADWAWILGAGVVMPFLWYLAIHRLTPLGARNWSVAASASIVPSGQFGALTWLMMVMPVLVARWRLRLRGIPSGSSRRRRWLFWTTTACGALAIPAFGLAHGVPSGGKIFITLGSVLFGVLVSVWGIIAMRALFSRQPRLLRRLILARALVPAYAFGMLLMALSMPIYHAAERHWVAQDQLTEITPEAPAMSRYEYQVAQALREEMSETLKTLR